jgi:hypothetical protein
MARRGELKRRRARSVQLRLRLRHERHLQAGNAPYGLTDLSNLLISRQMRPPPSAPYQPILTNEIEGLCGGRRSSGKGGRGGLTLTEVDDDPIELSREARLSGPDRQDRSHATRRSSRPAFVLCRRILLHVGIRRQDCIGLFLRLIDIGRTTSAHVSRACQRARRGGGVLDNTAGSPPASRGLPARVRSEKLAISAAPGDFKSLASTSSATSALLISIAFSSQAGKCFPIEPLRISATKPVHALSGRARILLAPRSSGRRSGCLPRLVVWLYPNACSVFFS